MFSGGLDGPMAVWGGVWPSVLICPIRLHEAMKETWRYVQSKVRGQTESLAPTQRVRVGGATYVYSVYMYSVGLSASLARTQTTLSRQLKRLKSQEFISIVVVVVCNCVTHGIISLPPTIIHPRVREIESRKSVVH